MNFNRLILKHFIDVVRLPWYDVQSFDIDDEKNGSFESKIFQVKATSTIRAVTGLILAGTVSFTIRGEDLEYEVYGGQWADKAIVGGIATFVTAGVLIVPAAVGAWKQQDLLKKLSNDVCLLNNQCINEIFLEKNDITPNEWWDSLGENWKVIIKKSIDIDYEPSDRDFEEIFNLKELKCVGASISNLLPIKHLRKIEKLYCSGININSINIVRYLTNLRELNCSNTKINTLEPLYSLNNLELLNCSHTAITSLKPLRDLNTLKELDCSGNELSTLAPIYKLPNLQKLIYSSTKLKETISIFKENRPDCNVKDTDSGCFVATTVYGSETEIEVNILRNFCDNYLRRNIVGRIFIKIYYDFGPYMAKFIQDQKYIKNIVRAFLDIFVSIIKKLK